MLVGRLKSSQAAPQYVSCLKRVVKDSLALCMENASLMTDLVDRIHTLGVNGAERTLEALLPLIKVRYLFVTLGFPDNIDHLSTSNLY